ncbi:MAG: energy-coupling factor transporter ATPase [Christensenellaceae bacterium]|nr:energy-coupling factor transporter ATPase [Christensenellaceae bacterium]
MDNIIEINDVSVTYQKDSSVIHAISHLTLNIKRGSFVAILGRNGSGKSTLAKLLNASLLPDSGEIFVDGINTTNEERAFDIRSKVGMVFQNPDNQMVATIIEDDLAFGPENLGIPREEIRKRVDWALKTVGMYEHRMRATQKLSGGQKQRVAIAAVLAMSPEVLILDEATAMLDPRGRSEVMDTARKLNKEKNITVVLITHYMDEAVDVDEIVVLDSGCIATKGSPLEVFEQIDIIKNTGLEFPTATETSLKLRGLGYDIPVVLTDESLVEALCQLK